MHGSHLARICLVALMGAACGDSVASTEPHAASTDSTGFATFPATDGPDTANTDAPTSGVVTTTAAPDRDPDPTPGVVVCGDGIRQGDEACDLAPADPMDPACNPHCQLASCGDGFVSPARGELCDAGENNVEVPGYNQCSNECKRGPHCGDGIRQPQEGCDDGDLNKEITGYNECSIACELAEYCGDRVIQALHEECEPGIAPLGTPTCNEDCSFWRRVIFMSSNKMYSGDLGGLDDADQLCDDLAGAGGLSGAFKAWLLVDSQDLSMRFHEYDGVKGTIHFVTTDNLPLAESFEKLIEDGAQNLIATEMEGHDYDEVVWTNITADGLASQGDCDAWGGLAGNAVVGNSGYDDETKHQIWLAERAWTASKVQSCVQFAHIYCLQVKD